MSLIVHPRFVQPEARNFTTTGDKVSIPSDELLNIVGDLSIYCLVKFNAGGVFHSLVSKTDANSGGTNNPFDFRSDNGADGNIELNITRADAVSFSDSNTTARNLSINVWYHLAVTSTSPGMINNFYVNGVLDGPFDAADRTPTTNAQPLLIGERGDGLGGNCRIALVGIHNVILSASEINEAHFRGFTSRGLVAAFVFFNGQVFELVRGRAATITGPAVPVPLEVPRPLALWPRRLWIPSPAAPAAGYPAAYYDRYQLGQNPGVM